MQRKLPHFNDSIMYEIEQIARYSQLHGKKFFNNVSTGMITPEEFKTLDVIMCNPDICQRDLAKIILMDRVRTGRILDSLEDKNLIKRFVDTKNNRVVRKMEITENGIKTFDDITEKLQPYLDNLRTKFTDTQLNELKNLLKLLKNAISELVKIEV